MRKKVKKLRLIAGGASIVGAGAWILVSTVPKKMENQPVAPTSEKESTMQVHDSSKQTVPRAYSSLDLMEEKKSSLDRNFDSELVGLTEGEIEALLQELKESSENWPEDRANFYLAWGSRDATQAVAHAKKHGGNSSSALISRSLTGWASQDREAASEWILAQEEGREKILFAKGLLSTMADASPEVKSEWIEQVAESPHSRAFVSAFTREWANTNPNKAIQWATNLTEKSVRKDSVQSVIKVWVKNDTEATANFLNEINEGGFRDEIVSYFVKEVVVFDKETALDWANSINDQEMKDTTKESINNFH